MPIHPSMHPAGDNHPNRDATRLAWALALVPFAGFMGEWVFAQRDGTFAAMRAHPTVMYGDWLLVPFNFLATRIIDWRRGMALFLIGAASCAMVALAHALWQAQGLAPAGFISDAGVVTRAGWVHLAYTTLETTLLLAFAFCRLPYAPQVTAARTLAVVYMLALAGGGYVFHHRLIASDASTAIGGLFVLLVWPGPGRRAT